MKIQGIHSVHASHAVQGPHRSSAPARSASSSLGEIDQLDISPSAHEASRALETSGIRADRVAQIRSAIASGTYDTDEKLSLALDRLIDQLG